VPLHAPPMGVCTKNPGPSGRCESERHLALAGQYYIVPAVPKWRNLRYHNRSQRITTHAFGFENNGKGSRSDKGSPAGFPHSLFRRENYRALNLSNNLRVHEVPPCFSLAFSSSISPPSSLLLHLPPALVLPLSSSSSSSPPPVTCHPSHPVLS
jgi:hypothetical protein